MTVLDASVLVEYLARGERFEPARRALRSVSGPLWAPHLVDAEVGHSLRRAVGAGLLAEPLALAALEDLAAMPLERAAHRELLARAWELRANVSFYDGLYIALAEALDSALVTFDARLAGVPGLRTQIAIPE